MGSADLMQRNLNARVEVLFPVEDEKLIRHLRDLVLETYLTDNTTARQMEPDGTFNRLTPKDGEPERATQEIFLAQARLHGEG